MGYVQYKIGDLINGCIRVDSIREGGLGRIYFSYCQQRKKKVVIKTINEYIWTHYELEEVWRKVKDSIINDTFPAHEIFDAEYLLFVSFREARISCQMQGHLNVSNGLSMWWAENGQVFFETEFIENSIDLEELHEKISLETDINSIGTYEAMHLVISFCNAMIYIHDKMVSSYNQGKDKAHQAESFVHRDIKPNNLLLTDQNMLKVIDLGLAKYVVTPNSLTHLTSRSISMGNDTYMSPEQRQSFEKVKPSSDVYSLGATFYKLLGGSIEQLQCRWFSHDPIEPLQNIPVQLMEILQKCLEIKPENRYQNFRQVKQAVVDFLKEVKSGSITINENLRCNTCGLIGNKAGDNPMISSRVITGKNGHRYKRIQGGSFIKGCKPEHERKLIEKFSRYVGSRGFEDKMKEVTIKSYEIDICAVTNQQFLNFIKTTGYQNLPGYWSSSGDSHFPPEIADHPVCDVSYNDAVAYCAWAECRLPTGDEWERAARGTQGNLYPWGDAYSGKMCNSAESGNNGTVPVQSYENGISPDGCFQMVGNVMEWVNESPAQSANYKYLRGGCWGDSCELFGLPFLHNLMAHPHNRNKAFGFRVARDSRSEIIPVATTGSEHRCPVCKGSLVPFSYKDIKIPEKNIFTWNGFFDIE